MTDRAPTVVGSCLLAGCLLAGGLIARRRLLVVTVRGSSMSPTLESGDRLLVYRTSRVRLGQLVVFTARPMPDAVGTPDVRLLVKRLAAGPGDRTPAALRQPAGPIRDARVPAGHYLVRGDNPASEDSRKFGYLRAEELRGVVCRRLPTPHRNAPAG